LASGFEYARLVSPYSMSGMNESSKIMYLQKTISDAMLSKNSIVVLDSIERMVEFVPIGPRFSTGILSSVIDILNTAGSTNNLLIIG
jgi:vesicle-fusing ATPase